MPQFVIERMMPGVGEMTDAEARATIVKSVDVLQDLGDEIRWLRSFVVDNKIYCIYFAPDETLIREHATRMGIPADRISAVRQLLEPGEHSQGCPG